MSTNFIATNTDLIVTALAGVSVFGAIMVACWSHLAPSAFRDRVRQVASGREEMRSRERTTQGGGKAQSLRTTRPKQIFKSIFDRMDLSGQAEDGEVVRRLRMAGFRGQGPVV